MVGDGAVGKTSLLSAWADGRVPREYIPSTLESGERTVCIHGRDVRLAFADSCGDQDHGGRLRLMAYSGVHVVLVCFSVVQPTSRDSVRTLWLPEAVSAACPRDRVLLVGTKCDLRVDAATQSWLRERHASPTTPEEGRALAAELGVAGYVECSASTGQDVAAVFAHAVHVASHAAGERAVNVWR